MDAGKGPLSVSYNLKKFPAKLWRLVNNPSYKAIWWDPLGEVIVIDQKLFEREILNPTTFPPDNPNAFKTVQFSSFVRQLNMYGFRKAERVDTGIKDHVVCHHFYHPKFKRDHPELVPSLKRLSVENKAKRAAREDVESRPVKRGSSLLHSRTHQGSTHPYYPNQAMVVQNGTPVPPHFLMMGDGAALSAAGYATDKVIPVSLSHDFTGVASSSNAVHPNFNIAQYQPVYYSPVCLHQNFVGSHMTGSELQTGQFSPSYYQAGYPVTMVDHGDNNQDEKRDTSLDIVLQFADEMMRTPTSDSMGSDGTPDNSSPVSAPLSNTCETVLFESPASATKVKPPCPLHITIAVSGNADVVNCELQEESVVSVPEDTIFQVTGDDARTQRSEVSTLGTV